MAKELDIKKMLKDQTEKLTEVFDDRIKAVTEQYNGIQKTLKSHTEEIAEIKVNVEEIRIDVMEVKSDVKTIKFEMVAVMNTKADKKLIIDLDHRVRHLEKK